MRNFQFRILTILLSAIFSNYPHNTHNGKYSLLNPSSIHAVRNFQFRITTILLSAIFSNYPITPTMESIRCLILHQLKSIFLNNKKAFNNEYK